MSEYNETPGSDSRRSHFRPPDEPSQDKPENALTDMIERKSPHGIASHSQEEGGRPAGQTGEGPARSSSESGRNDQAGVSSNSDGESSTIEGSASKSRSDRNFWPLTSLTLIQRMKDEETGSWDDFVFLYGKLIRGFCSRRLPESDVEDIVQCIFIRILRGIQKFTYDHRKASFGGWVGKITRNEILRHYVFLERERNVHTDCEMGDVVAGTTRGDWDDAFTGWLLETALERVREEVSENQWRLFLASWKSELPLNKQARELNVDVNALYKARHYVSAKLREIIRNLTDDHPFASPDETGA